MPRLAPCRPASSRPTLLALAAVASLLSGCSGDRDVLARVGGETITLARFEEAAPNDPRYAEGPADSAKARLLTDLVTRALFLEGARREGLAEFPEVRAFRQRLEQQTLREMLFERLLRGPFAVSEAEVRELYRRRASATRARLIFTDAEGSARQALRDLARGDDFASVADRYNPPGMVPPGGDIGFVQPGAMLPPLDDILRTAPPGRAVGPLPGGVEGWFVVRVEERRSEPQPPLEMVGAQLGAAMRQRKQRVAFLNAVERIRVEHAVSVTHGAPQSIMNRFRLPPGADPSARVAPPGPDERGQVLARYREGTYTLGEAYDDLLNATDNRPDLAMLPTVERWIETQTLERAALAEARERRIHEEPEFQRRVRNRLDERLLEWYVQRQVAVRIRVEPKDVEAAYQRNKASFTRLEAARVVAVTLRDSAAAATLAEQAGHARTLREAAVMAAAGGQAREQNLTFPAAAPLWTRFEGRLQSMNAGEIAGPYRTPGGWLIVQLLDKRQGAPPFESLPAGARDQLASAAADAKRDQLLGALADSLRSVIRPIESHPDRLRRVPWAPSPAGPTGS